MLMLQMCFLKCFRCAVKVSVPTFNILTNVTAQMVGGNRLQVVSLAEQLKELTSSHYANERTNDLYELPQTAASPEADYFQSTRVYLKLQPTTEDLKCWVSALSGVLQEYCVTSIFRAATPVFC